MRMQKITREEFDQRLQQSTELMRQSGLGLEKLAAELEDLIGRYASALEHMEAKSDSMTEAVQFRREE